MKPTLGDMFCGAGGFSEGFRQAGFRISWAIDNWAPAANTFAHNHRSARVIQEDISQLRLQRLEGVDVLIGSPPCTEFSLANRGGGGDRAAGMAYVRRFLQAVQTLKPKYWIMENVPNLNTEIERLLDRGSVKLPGGVVEVPRCEVLLASEYGVPQARKRLFCGSFPSPEKLMRDGPDGRPRLGTIIDEIPSPCHPVGKAEEIQDPNYPSIQIPSSKLRVHFEDHRWNLSADELRECELQKREHPVYGSMPFPDRLDDPARTITSTRVRTSRSTIIVPCTNPIHDQRILRTLTARECASVQSFPLTFQFWCDTISDADRMIGNAVPPSLGFAFAKAILRAEGLRCPAEPLVRSSAKVPPLLAPRFRREKRYPSGRRFRRVCKSEWSHDCRVELDNAGVNPEVDSVGRGFHAKEWVPRLYLGYAKRFKGYELDSTCISRIGERVIRAWPEGPALAPLLREVAADAVGLFLGRLPDATELQRQWARGGGVGISPSEIIEQVDGLVRRHLPDRDWSNVRIPSAIYATTLTGKVFNQGELAPPGCPRDLTVRILAILITLSIACDGINRRTGPFLLDVTSGMPVTPVANTSARRESASLTES